MLPHEIRSRRDRFPAAFVGLGALEWHSEHLAVGLDGLVADALCDRAAAQSGGFAFPTLWYGEPRESRLMESTFDQDGQIKSKMGINPAKFAAGYFGKSAEEAVEFYQALIYHLLIQMNTLEMRAVCLLAGHGPLSDFARPVVERFNRAFSDTQAFVGFETDYAPEGPGLLGADRDAPYFPAPLRAEGGLDDTGKREIWYREVAGGDHAGKWETSYLWYLRPDCVDLSIYRGREAEPLIGVFGLDPRRTASVEAGRRACAAIVQGMIRVAKELIGRSQTQLPR
jgi:creatinine amidohydrolase/Fe(II)-dependent formamide hydrolase-like protein